jgi:Arc/MetJ family transcription regulator
VRRWVWGARSRSAATTHQLHRAERGRAEALHHVVYRGVVTRTNIDIDDDLVERAMRAFGLHTKREAVQLALERLLGGGPMSVEEQLDMEGIGWDGDLDAMRQDRLADRDQRAAG